MDIPSFLEIFKQININLKICGIPLDGSGFRFWFYIMLLFLNLMLVEEMSFFVSMITADNFLKLTALAPCIGIGALSMAKIIALVVKRHKLFKLIDCLRELYKEILEDPEKIELVGSEIILVKSVTKFYFILNTILISVYNFATLFIMLYIYLARGEMVYMLPYAVKVPFSTEIWLNWLIVYLHSITSGFICVLYYTTVDALYCNLCCQVCSNFTIISRQIELLTSETADSLKAIVKKHQYILQLSEMLEEIFTVPNLINMLVGSVEICALGFNLMTADWNQIPGFVLFLLSELVQILIMSIFGENIINESRKIGEAAFSCEWYNMKQQYRKIILIIMIRAHKPQKLTANKFSVICYGSFTKIISTSWSYFTILRTIYKPAEVTSIE